MNYLAVASSHYEMSGPTRQDLFALLCGTLLVLLCICHSVKGMGIDLKWHCHVILIHTECYHIMQVM